MQIIEAGNHLRQLPASKRNAKKNFEALFYNDIVLAKASLVGVEKLVDAFKKFFESEKIIR